MIRPRLWIVLLTLLFAAFEARGDGIIKMRAGYMRLTLRQCTNAAVAGFIAQRGEHLDVYRQGVGMLNGKPFYACWKPHPGGAYLVDEDGDSGSVPLDAIGVAPEA